MSASDAGDSDRAEPIDVEWEPAEKRRGDPNGVSLKQAILFSVAAAMAGGAMGAAASKAPILEGLEQDPKAPPSPALVADPALSQRLAAVETRWREIELAMGGGEAEQIAARLIDVERTLSTIEGRMDGADVSALARQVAALQSQTDTIRAQSDIAATAARAAFAVAAATEAARGSGPFEGAMATLQVVLPANADVAALAPFAPIGAPSRQQLKDEYKTVERDILRAARVSAAGSGLWARLIAFLSEHVTVRQAGAGHDAVALVERAGGRLADDDVAGAVAELSRLPGAPAKVAEPWLAKARARLEIDARLGAIRQELARGRIT